MVKLFLVVRYNEWESHEPDYSEESFIEVGHTAEEMVEKHKTIYYPNVIAQDVNDIESLKGYEVTVVKV